jgi:bifunctional UDP-N-acetylglucosamine pyrophosphorylase/glucosamine-1-phosphate N-acetyltransferase
MQVEAVRAADHRETLGVNDRAQLAAAGRVLRERINDAWMRAGVTIVDPASTWIDVDVQLEPDVTIEPDTRLHGRTTVAAGAVVGPASTLTDTAVGPGARVRHSYCDGAEIGPEANVGPFTYLRPGARLGPRAKAGAYVEIKGSDVGADAKVPHLSYVGDATIGERSNIGAATVFVNYDGVDKHRTTVGDDARVGSDTMLVAPVTVGDGAYTAAGSVIDKDVPPGALGVGRSRQRNVDGWVARRRPGTPADDAARRSGRGDDADGENQ